MDHERALVLGGGGLAGIAWLTGVLHGLSEAGVSLGDADLVLGTSAGSTVGAQLASGLPLAELYQRQVDPARQNRELTPTGIPLPELLETMVTLSEEVPDPVERRRRFGAIALSTPTVTEPERRAVIEGRLPKHEWPGWRLAVVAVDAHTGETAVFDRDSGVGLVEAVAASCAVPGVWPPVTINGARYVDGGIRTFTNADLARDYRRVLVLAPMPEPTLPDELAAFPGRTELVQPDADALAAFGTDPLDPATRVPAAEAGLAQGRREADRVRALWV